MFIARALGVKSGQDKMPFKFMKPTQIGPPIKNSLFLTWQVPESTSHVNCYTLEYKTVNNEDESQWVLIETEVDEPRCMVRNLHPETFYQFRVAANMEDDTHFQSETSDVMSTASVERGVNNEDASHPNRPSEPITASKITLSSPGTPRLSADPTHDSLTVVWDISEEEALVITHYFLCYKDVEEDIWVKREISGACNEFTLCDLKPQTTYVVQVVSHTPIDTSPPSEISDPFTTDIFRSKGHIFREKIKKCSSHVKSDKDMPLYQVHLRVCQKDRSKRLQKFEFGTPKSGEAPPEKVVLVVGATGAGKSTLINGLINFILGVEWKDGYRFRLVQESGSFQTQYKSQTQQVTVYTLHHQDEFKVPYTLTIIDTPGFGDTGGIGRDKQITEAITNLFSIPEYGVDHIDAIGFVTQSALARLTPSQKYIFDSILSLFGKDIAENIFLLITFCDSQKPPVLASISKANIPFHTSFKFNNSALFADNNSEDEEFDQMFWIMGILSFQKFLHALMGVEGKSLYLTKEVLAERYQLEVYVMGIQEDIQNGLNKLEQYKTEIAVVRQHEADIRRNRDFTYTVNEQKMVHEDLKPGQHVTNCVQCNRTCHYLCAYANDEDKKSCCAMDAAGNCTVCDKKCIWSIHHNVPYRIVVHTVTVTKTADDLKMRYQQACGEKMNAEKLVENILDDFYELQMKILYMTNEVRRGIARLKDIALRPDPLSMVEYLDLLIESEKAEAHPGWKQRVHQLRQVMAQAETLSRLAMEGYDPFTEYKEMLKQANTVKERPSWKRVADDIKKKCSATYENILRQFRLASGVDDQAV